MKQKHRRWYGAPDRRNDHGVRNITYDRGDSLAPFIEWHHTLPYGLFATDADHFEYRILDGRPVLVAYFELTMIRSRFRNRDHERRYLRRVLLRYESSSKGRISRQIAEALKIPFWLVAYYEDCSRFWLYSEINPRWIALDADEMADLIVSLNPERKKNEGRSQNRKRR